MNEAGIKTYSTFTTQTGEYITILTCELLGVIFHLLKNSYIMRYLKYQKLKCQISLLLPFNDSSIKNNKTKHQDKQIFGQQCFKITEVLLLVAHNNIKQN